MITVENDLAGILQSTLQHRQFAYNRKPHDQTSSQTHRLRSAFNDRDQHGFAGVDIDRKFVDGTTTGTPLFDSALAPDMMSY